MRTVAKTVMTGVASSLSVTLISWDIETHSFRNEFIVAISFACMLFIHDHYSAPTPIP